MPTDSTPQNPTEEPAASGTDAAAGRLTPAAARALAEAAERRARRNRHQAAAPNESGGRGGLDPVRYGDWEVNGLSSDF
jgi:hypothetical protein